VVGLVAARRERPRRALDELGVARDLVALRVGALGELRLDPRELGTQGVSAQTLRVLQRLSALAAARAGERDDQAVLVVEEPVQRLLSGP
jgi:hypothetical protein